MTNARIEAVLDAVADSVGGASVQNTCCGTYQLWRGTWCIFQVDRDGLVLLNKGTYAKADREAINIALACLELPVRVQMGDCGWQLRWEPCEAFPAGAVMPWWGSDFTWREPSWRVSS